VRSTSTASRNAGEHFSCFQTNCFTLCLSSDDYTLSFRNSLLLVVFRVLLSALLSTRKVQPRTLWNPNCVLLSPTVSPLAEVNNILKLGTTFRLVKDQVSQLIGSWQSLATDTWVALMIVPCTNTSVPVVGSGNSRIKSGVASAGPKKK